MQHTMSLIRSDFSNLCAEFKLELEIRANIIIIIIHAYHSCQVYMRRDWDQVENRINTREILRTTPTFGQLCIATPH